MYELAAVVPALMRQNQRKLTGHKLAGNRDQFLKLRRQAVDRPFRSILALPDYGTSQMIPQTNEKRKNQRSVSRLDSGVSRCQRWCPMEEACRLPAAIRQ